MSQSRLTPLRESLATALITQTSRQAFELEALERESDLVALARMRVDYHAAMAALLALTALDCPELPDRVQSLRVCQMAHLEVLKHWHNELAKLEGQGA